MILILTFFSQFSWAENYSWRSRITWINNSGMKTNPIQTTRQQIRWSRRPPTICRLPTDRPTDCRSSLDILSLKLYLSREFFFPLFLSFFLCWEINLSKMHVYFPLITNLNSRRENSRFSSFVWQTSQLPDILQSQTLLMNF